jgi:hypothetical protein
MQLHNTTSIIIIVIIIISRSICNFIHCSCSPTIAVSLPLLLNAALASVAVVEAVVATALAITTVAVTTVLKAWSMIKTSI